MMLKTGTRRFLIGLVGVFSLAVLAVGGCSRNQGDTSVTSPNPDPFHPVGTIQGVVRDRITLQPIVGALVSIDLKSAKTDEQGSYVLKDVPATYDAHAGDGYSVYGNYTVEVDLSNAYTRDENGDIDIDMRKDGGVRYPRIKYEEAIVPFTSLDDTSCETELYDDISDCVNATNHDTPVDHLASSHDINIGKLACSITGKVYGCDSSDLQAAEFATPQVAEVRLVSEINSKNSATGADGSILGSTTSAADGSFTFNNIECGNVPMEVTAASPSFTDPQRDDTVNISSPEEDFATLVMGLEHVAQNDPDKTTALHLCINDALGPKVISVVPEPGSDLAPNANGETVTITFHEPVHQTPQTATGQAAVDSLNDYIDVNFDGNKSGNIPYTLAWLPAGCAATDTCTQLQVTFVTGASSLYNVTIQNLGESGRFTDAAGNVATTGVCPTSAPGPWTDLDGGEAEDDCVVYFSTFGGNTPDAPVIDLVNAGSLDEGTPAQVGSYDWGTTGGAKTYNMYCRRVQVWEDGTTQTHPYLLVGAGNGGTVTGSSATVDFDVFGDGESNGVAFVENSEIALHYECFVRGVSSDSEEGPDSNVVEAEDVIGPQVVGTTSFGGGWWCGAGSTSGGLPTGFGGLCTDPLNPTDINQLIVALNENLREGTAETTTNYTFQGLVSGGTAVVSTAAADKPVYNAATNMVLLTLSDSLSPDEIVAPAVLTGANGLLETITAGGDTTITAGLNAGIASTFATRGLCVYGGGSSDSTAQNDDVVSGANITVGPDGICDTPANNAPSGGVGGFDVQVVAVGARSGVCATEVTGGSDIAESGDDVDEDTGGAATFTAGDDILSGPNGICDTLATDVTTAAGVLRVAQGNGTPNAVGIAMGGDVDLDTTTLNNAATCATVTCDDDFTGSSLLVGSGVLDVNGNALRDASTTPTGNNVYRADGRAGSQ